MKFVKVVDGPSSYSTGGFTQRIGEFEKVSGVSGMIDPETALGTGTLAGLDLSIGDAPDHNLVTIKVHEIDSDTKATTWAEVAADTDLSGADFILTGDGL